MRKEDNAADIGSNHCNHLIPMLGILNSESIMIVTMLTKTEKHPPTTASDTGKVDSIAISNIRGIVDTTILFPIMTRKVMEHFKRKILPKCRTSRVIMLRRMNAKKATINMIRIILFTFALVLSAI